MRRGRRNPPVLATISAAPPPGEAPAWRLRRSDYESLGSLLEALNGSRAVLLTGAEGGKTAAAVGFATVAAAAGRRTALVECDLARPALAGSLGVLAAPGLGEYLRQEASAPRILQPLILAGPASAGATSPLTCVVAGAPTPGGHRLLASEGFAHAISKLRNAYDLVVLDGPPLDRDATSLGTVAPLVDTTLACVAGARAPRKPPVELAGLVSLEG